MGIRERRKEAQEELSEERVDPKNKIAKEGRDVKDDQEEATIYTETLKNPEELMKVLVKNGSVGKPCGEGV